MANSSIAPSAARGRLSTARILGFAAPDIPSAALLLVMSTYLPNFYTGYVGLSLLAFTFATTTVRFVDIVFDPFIGWVMDRTRLKVGRFRPWYVVGVPFLMVGLYMVLNPAKGATTNYLMIWYLVAYIGISITVLSHAAWAASMAGDYHQRSRIYGWMTAVAAVGSIGLLILPLVTHGKVVLGKGESMGTVSLIIVALLPLMTLVMLATSPERASVDVQNQGQRFALADYWSMLTRPTMLRLIGADLILTLGPGITAPIYFFFFNQVKHFHAAQISFLLVPYIGAALLGGLFWAQVSLRIGKHRTLQVGALCYAVTQSTLMIIPDGLFWPTMAGMFAVGFCVSVFVLMIRAMVADYADEIRLEQGKERTGILYAMVTTTQKIGASINVLIVFPILALFGFNPKMGAHNTDHALFGLQMCYLFAPVVFVFLGAAMFIGYKLDAKRHAEIRAALDERDEALATAISIEAPIA